MPTYQNLLSSAAAAPPRGCDTSSINEGSTWSQSLLRHSSTKRSSMNAHGSGRFNTMQSQGEQKVEESTSNNDDTRRDGHKESHDANE